MMMAGLPIPPGPPVERKVARLAADPVPRLVDASSCGLQAGARRGSVCACAGVCVCLCARVCVCLCVRCVCVWEPEKVGVKGLRETELRAAGR